MTVLQRKAFLLPTVFAATLSILRAGCSSSKPRVTETTVTQTNPDTGTTVSKTTGVSENPKGNETTTWSSTTLKNE